MLKVLYVSPSAEQGGLERVLLSILGALDRSRFTAGVALLEDGPLVNDVRGTGTDTRVVTSGRVRNLVRGVTAVARLVRLIVRERFDLVHTMNAKAHLYGGAAAVLSGVPCVHHLQGVPRRSLSRDGLVNFLSAVVPATRTVACSNYVAEGFRRAWRSRRPVAVVHNGLLPGPRDGHPSAVRLEFGIPSQAPLIVMIARLQRWKGVHIFVDAAGEVARRRSDVRFLVVGGTLFGLEQEYAEELRVRVDRLGLGHALRFVGHRRDTQVFFQNADVAVHASIDAEPFGMVLLEAMAAGKPVVASDQGGPREIVLHGETGYLVPPNRADLLAKSILSLIERPDLRVKMGQAAAARFEACFRAEQMCRGLEQIYTQITSRPRSDRPAAE